MDDTTEILPQNIQLFLLQVCDSTNHTQKSCSGLGRLCVYKVHTKTNNWKPVLSSITEKRHTVVTVVASEVCFPPALKDSIFNVLHVLITSALLKAYYICSCISQATTQLSKALLSALCDNFQSRSGVSVPLPFRRFSATDFYEELEV